MILSTKLVMALILASISLLINAKDSIPSSAKKATAALELASSWLPQHCFHSGKFEQRISLPGLEKPLVSTGRFLYSCENGLIWAAQEPVFDALVAIYNPPDSKNAADRKSARVLKINEGGEAVELQGRAERAIAELISALFGGDVKVLGKRFDLSSGSEQLTLTPRRNKLKKFLSEIIIDKVNALPATHMFFASGKVQRIYIDDARFYEALDIEKCVSASLPQNICEMAFGVNQHASTK